MNEWLNKMSLDIDAQLYLSLEINADHWKETCNGWVFTVWSGHPHILYVISCTSYPVCHILALLCAFYLRVPFSGCYTTVAHTRQIGPEIPPKLTRIYIRANYRVYIYTRYYRVYIRVNLGGISGPIWRVWATVLYAGTCIINYAPTQINVVVMTLGQRAFYFYFLTFTLFD